MFKLFGHFKLILVFVVFVSTINAKSFENFQNSYRSSSIVYKYKDDEEFSEVLLTNWDAFVLENPRYIYEKPKPSKIYPARRLDVKKIGPKINVLIEEKTPLATEEINQNIENVLHFDDGFESTKDISFNFFGATVEFNIPHNLQNAKFYPQNQHGIKSFYDVASLSEYEILLKNIEAISQKLEINDWGKYLLVDKISKKIFSNQDEIKLFKWFVFNKLGYAVKISIVKKHIVVMYKSDKIIYAIPRAEIGNKHFYILDDTNNGLDSSIFTYEQCYPNATKSFDMSMERLPNFPKDEKSITIPFMIDGQNYKVFNRYNQNLIDFMATYPQADYETFFNTPLDDETYKDIAISIKKYIDTKKASEAIDFILKFVQKAFKYETDQKQFGKEKVMFAQETLYYEKSDCEDRAILFAYLIEKLLNIKSIGLKYSDHMATALYIPMRGDSVKVNGKKFIIADPTYINATIGQSMPKYKGVKPQSYIIKDK